MIQRGFPEMVNLNLINTISFTLQYYSYRCRGSSGFADNCPTCGVNALTRDRGLRVARLLHFLSTSLGWFPFLFLFSLGGGLVVVPSLGVQSCGVRRLGGRV